MNAVQENNALDLTAVDGFLNDEGPPRPERTPRLLDKGDKTMKPIELNLPAAEYHAAAGLSASFLAALDRTPACAALLRLKPPPTPAMIIGSALHCMVLEPSEFPKRYTSAGTINLRTKEGKLKRDLLRTGGMEILSIGDYGAVMSMADSIAAHPLARTIRDEPGFREASLFWEIAGFPEPLAERKPPLPCKARPDCFQASTDIMWDLKTCRAASPDEFLWQVKRLRYHLKAAWYMQGAAAVGWKVKDFLWLAVENEQPFNVAVIRCPAAALDEGWQRCEELLDLYRTCTVMGVWPRSYGEGVLELPWHAKQIEVTLDGEKF
jgi:exodeoxyribonuclease VIII